MDCLIRVLIVAFLFRVSSARNVNYHRDALLNDLKCIGADVEFDTDVHVDSPIQCVALCEKHPDCKGVFHKRSSASKCYGCRKVYDGYSGGLDTENGTRYYTPYGCADGWDQLGDKCYLFNQNGLSWNDAQAHCVSVGAALLKVEDSPENAFAQTKCKDYRVSYWIGAKYMASTGEFRWWDNSTITFNGWQPGQPDGEGCVCYNWKFNYMWDNLSNCNQVLNSICEKPTTIGA